jgi:hypothetical protein
MPFQHVPYLLYCPVPHGAGHSARRKADFNEAGAGRFVSLVDQEADFRAVRGYYVGGVAAVTDHWRVGMFVLRH